MPIKGSILARMNISEKMAAIGDRSIMPSGGINRLKGSM